MFFVMNFGRNKIVKGVVKIIKFQFAAFFLRNMRHIGIESVFYTKIGIERTSEINLAVFKGRIFRNIKFFHDKRFHGIKGFRVLGKAFEADVFFQNVKGDSASGFLADFDKSEFLEHSKDLGINDNIDTLKSIIKITEKIYDSETSTAPT